MDNEIWLLITIVRKEDMDLLKYVYKASSDTYFGQTYRYWGEPEVAAMYSEIFDFDDEVVVLDVEEIDGMK